MKRMNYTLIGSCVALLGVTACTTAESPRISSLEQQLSATKQQNTSLESELVALRSQPSQVAAAGEPLLPASAKAGECFARVFVPPNYQTTTENVVRSEASERVEIVPAKYGMAEQRVLTREASERIEVIPATYRTVTERVPVVEESARIETTPAVYGTVTEQVMVQPAYTTWKKGRGPIEKINEATGEIMCLVTVPAEYKTVTKRVLKTAATSRTVAIPAQYKTVTKQVVATPASTRVVAIPAEYGTVKVQKLITPAKENRIAIPAQYQTVSKTAKVSDGRLEWRPILCETNVTSGIVRRLQTALVAKGYNPGPVDGVLGGETMGAVKKYQRASSLPSGQLTMETLKSLDVGLGI